MKGVLGFAIPILVCLLVGFTGSMFQSESIHSWYPYLNRSSLTPPNIVFPIAWGILYLCMGLSVGFFINSKRKERFFFIGLFIFQLVLNFSWSVLFFYLQNPMAGFIDILALFLVIVFYTIWSYRVIRLSALLFIPYVLWVGFASYLNLFILLNN